MIDFEKAEKQFKEYLKKYVLEDGTVHLKVVHTYGVIKCSEYIANSLNLEEEQIKLAKLIALLHDIGRFEQITITGKWEDDQGLDHAQYGVKLLFEEKLIRNFIEEDTYDLIIKKAICNHSLLKIEEGLSEEKLLYAKIIRDADKLDNYRVKEEEKLEHIITYELEDIEHQEISPKVYKSFIKKQCIKVEDRKTAIDVWVCVLAFIFDFNFKISLQYVKEHDYINKMIDRIDYQNEDTKRKMEEIRKIALTYLKEKERN